MRSKLSKIVEITDETISKQYEIGSNDCNILILRHLDTMTGSNYAVLAIGQYTTIKDGYKLFKKNGFANIEDVVKTHCTEVDVPIFGDIYINGINASIVLNGTYLQVDHNNNTFSNVPLPKDLEGTFYRINKE